MATKFHLWRKNPTLFTFEPFRSIITAQMEHLEIHHAFCCRRNGWARAEWTNAACTALQCAVKYLLRSNGCSVGTRFAQHVARNSAMCVLPRIWQKASCLGTHYINEYCGYKSSSLWTLTPNMREQDPSLCIHELQEQRNIISHSLNRPCRDMEIKF